MLTNLKLLLVTAVCLGLFVLTGCLQQAQAQGSVKSLIEAHTEAIGGNKAIAKIKTLQREGVVSGNSNFGPLSGSVKNVYDFDVKKSLTATDLGTYQRKAVWAGKESWVKDSAQGFTDLPANEAAFLEYEFGISPLLMIYRKHPTGGLKITDDKEINGKKCKTIATMDSKIEFYLDPKTNLLVGLKMEGISMLYEDYKAENGIQLSNKQTTKMEDQGLTMVVEFKKTLVNQKVDAAVFTKTGVTEKPAANKAPTGGLTAEQIIGYMDKDGDKKISKDEASAELKPNFGPIDTDGDGFIDVKEAQAIADYANGQAVTDTKPATPSTRGKVTAKKIIVSMDKNKDGKISKEEADDETRLFFDDIDTNKDGSIDEKEAKVMADHVNSNG